MKDEKRPTFIELSTESERQRLESMFLNQTFSAMMSIGLGVSLGGFYYKYTPKVATVFLAIILIFGGLRIFFSKKYLKNNLEKDKLQLRKDENVYSLIVMFQMSAWALMTIQIERILPNTTQNLITTMFAIGIIVAGMSNTASSYKTSAAFLIGSIVPYTIYQFVNIADKGPLLAIGCVFLNVFILKMIIHANAQNHELLATNEKHKKLISSLEDKDKQLSLFYENSPFGFAFCDMQGNLIDVNKQYEEITGYTLEELKKLSYWDITPKKYEADEAIQLESLSTTGRYGPYRKEYVQKSGEIIPVELNGFIVKDFEGQEGIWSIVIDISDQLQHEQEMLQQKQIALHQSKLASIGELAAGVGHEINNPLAIAKGYLINMERKINHDQFDAETFKNDIRKVQNATDRIVRIVKGLRTFSRSDIDEVKDFSPIEAVQESFDMVGEIYKQEGINLSFNNFTFSDYIIKGNRGKLQQILLNLIYNARDATVGLSERNITINLNYINEKLLIDIIDNGKGIPKELREKIFDPFFSTKAVNKGTGIGLSLVQTYVHELDGVLHLESEVGKGTTFRIEIPATQVLLDEVKKPA